MLPNLLKASTFRRCPCRLRPAQTSLRSFARPIIEIDGRPAVATHDCSVAGKQGARKCVLADGW